MSTRCTPKSVRNFVGDTTYEWDAFGRLRKIKNRSTSNLVAEYRYNGLGYRIGIHEDTDTDGDVDSNDKWFYRAFDEHWRWVATLRENDSDPKEEFLHHASGFDGQGTGSYIDLVVLRNRDANTPWASASDGTLEERLYYCQNWRADVVALVTHSGGQVEQLRYSAYGVPFGLPAGDCDSDGDCDASDQSALLIWIGPPQSYDARGDVNLDGFVDLTDQSHVSGLVGIAMGRGVVSSSATDSQLAWEGAYVLSDLRRYDRRFRLSQPYIGTWQSRDPLGEKAGINLFELLRSSPMDLQDPLGLMAAGTPAVKPAHECKQPDPFFVHNEPELFAGVFWKLKCHIESDGQPEAQGCHGKCKWKVVATCQPWWSSDRDGRYRAVDCKSLNRRNCWSVWGTLQNMLYYQWHGTVCVQCGGDPSAAEPTWSGPGVANNPRCAPGTSICRTEFRKEVTCGNSADEGMSVTPPWR